MSSSSGEKPAGGGVSDQEDLEQRLGDRMGAALNQRMDAMMGQLSSMLQGTSRGGGDRRESGGGGSAAGDNFVPDAQAGASGGTGMSSIPGRTPAVDPEGSQEGSQEDGGLDSPRGELASSVGSGAGFGGAAVFSFAKQLPRVQPPQFKGNREEYLSFRADFLRVATLLELKNQFVGPSRVTDVTKDSHELLSEGFTRDQISAGKNEWNLLSTALQSRHAKSITRQCSNAKQALQELDTVYSPDTQGAKQELFRRFNRFSFAGRDDPIQRLNDLELIWGQLNDKDGGPARHELSSDQIHRHLTHPGVRGRPEHSRGHEGPHQE